MTPEKNPKDELADILINKLLEALKKSPLDERAKKLETRVEVPVGSLMSLALFAALRLREWSEATEKPMTEEFVRFTDLCKEKLGSTVSKPRNLATMMVHAICCVPDEFFPDSQFRNLLIDGLDDYTRNLLNNPQKSTPK